MLSECWILNVFYWRSSQIGHECLGLVFSRPGHESQPIADVVLGSGLCPTLRWVTYKIQRHGLGQVGEKLRRGVREKRLRISRSVPHADQVMLPKVQVLGLVRRPE